MRTCNDTALFEALFADNGQHERLAAIIAVDLIAGFELHAVGILDKALFLSKLDGELYGLALGTRLVEKGHIGAAVVLHINALLCSHGVVSVFLLVK